MNSLLLATDADWLFDEVDAALADEHTSVYRVRAGRMVLAAVRELNPDLVVLDSQIGNLGGVATSLALRHEQEMDRAAFLLAFNSDEMREGVRGDFALTQSVGIRGFPALCAARGNELHLIVNGYAPIDVVEQGFARLT